MPLCNAQFSFRVFNKALLRLGVRRYPDIVTGGWRDVTAVDEMFWRQLHSDMYGPQTVVHGDAHAGNIYFDSRGNPGSYDWQLVRRGSWAYDVGYCLTSVLTVDQRRMWERDLLCRYLERLQENEVRTVPDEQQAWRVLRRQSAYGFVAWLETLATGGFHDSDICVDQGRRFATAGEDHRLFTDRTLWT